MSKLDAQRAVREARMAERQKAASASPAAASRRAARSPVAPPVAPPDAVPDDEADAGAEALCGHRNISGRTCTREHGHAAKSHRYS